jgi:hypothetical protein
MRYALTACGPGCGYCGRCTDDLDRAPAQHGVFPTILCDQCHERRAYIGLSGLGVFCSQACADTASHTHAQRMDPRRI